MKRRLLFILLFLTAFACSQGEPPVGEKIASALGSGDDPDSPFYIDAAAYPETDSPEFRNMPIGVFDSGTGGLTVLEAILDYDGFGNASGNAAPDGVPDFSNEDFEYLGDLANMPYGNYSGENRTDFLEELSVKDALFLLGGYRHESPESGTRLQKLPVKTVVIACNTATAYGKTAIEQAIDYLKLDVDVIGVVDAGARGSLETLGKADNGTIGVMATVGTVASDGYPKAVRLALEQNGYTSTVDIVQQGGIGIAEAIDNDPDYLDRNRTSNKLRDRYAGPSVTHEKYKIDLSRLPVYNFVETGGELPVKRSGETIEDIQINSVRNYVRYHVTELLMKMADANASAPLRSIILGCTHYPYIEDEIAGHLEFLAAYTDGNGVRPFAELLSGEVVLVDPAELTAREAYLSLKKRNALRAAGGSNTEFYVSTPNMELPGVRANAERRFEYDYKYGRLPFYADRSTAMPPVYVLRVPMIWETLDEAVIAQIRERLPKTYSAMERYNGAMAGR